MPPSALHGLALLLLPLYMLRDATGAKSDAPTPRIPLMAPPEEWVEQLRSLNTLEPRSAAVRAYLSQLVMVVTGAGFHCGHTPGFNGQMEALSTCLHRFRKGYGTHRSWGVGMAGIGRMLSVIDMVEDVARRNLTGSYAETGVWRGGTTIVATAALRLNGMAERPVYLCDSFRGLPLPRKDSIQATTDVVFHRQPLLAVGVQSVLANFERYGVPHERVQPVVGYFVDSMPKLREELIARGERLSILRLDGDMYDSTVDVLYNLYDLLLPGGYLVVDDFGWPYKAGRGFGARSAVMDFRGLHGIEDAPHALRNIDDNGAWWMKAREVVLRRDAYLETLRYAGGENRSASQEALLVPPKPNWRGRRGESLVDYAKGWQASWTAKEREAADAITSVKLEW